MKLAFIIGSLHIGGAERVITELCGALAERGHAVTLIYSFKNRDYEVNGKVRQIDLDSFEYDFYHGSKLLRIRNKIATVYNDYKFLSSFIKEEQPDCFISFMRCWAWLLMLCFRKETNIVFSEHSSMHRNQETIGRYIKRNFLLPRSKAVTVLTHYDQGVVYNRMKNAICMPNPLTFDPINIDEYESLFPLRHNILACGRLNNIKGFDNLIRAFAKVANNFPEWNLDIAGKDMPGTHYSDYLGSLIKENNLEHRVKLIGFHSDVKNLMKNYSIFTVSSRSEGFSLTLTEAMASGMACISYELSGPREITLNEVDGLLVDDQNIEALAEGLARLMSDKALRYNLGKMAITNVQRYNADVIVKRWEKLFRKIVSK